MKKITQLLVILLLISITIVLPVSAGDQLFSNSYSDEFLSKTDQLKVSCSDDIIDEKLKLYCDFIVNNSSFKKCFFL